MIEAYTLDSTLTARTCASILVGQGRVRETTIPTDRLFCIRGGIIDLFSPYLFSPDFSRLSFKRTRVRRGKFDIVFCEQIFFSARARSICKWKGLFGDIEKKRVG